MTKPLIGISSRPRLVKTSSGESRAYCLQHTYRDAIVHAGGIPVSLAPVPVEDTNTLLDSLDGLVLSGGGDVNPALWGDEQTDASYGVSDERDTFEMALARSAAKSKTPTLAICRGLQIMNAAFGGTLIADIPTTFGTEHTVRGDGVFTTHQTIHLDAGCRVAEITDATTVHVNSIHHQSVDKLGAGFKVVGRSDDGVIEVIEHEDAQWWLVAVQWHPEYLDQVDDKHSRLIFEALIENAASR